MANQIIIDIGAAANDGTGDPLRTAFNYVNENFTSIWDTGVANSNVSFSGNRILTLNTNGNLVLAPNGTGKVQANVDIIPNSNNTHSLGSPALRWNTVYAQNLDVGGTTEFNNLTVNGNLTVDGDIIQIGNIVTDSKTIQLANTAGTDAAANGSGITVGASDDIATLLYNSANNVWTTNIGISATGNIQGQYFVGNGSLLTGITSYGNANVAAYLPTYTGNLSSGNLSVSSAGNTWTIANQFLTGPGGAYWHSHPEQGTDDFVSAPGSDITLQSIDANSVVESQINLTSTDIELVVINGVTKTWRFNESGVSEIPGDITPVTAGGSLANLGNVSNPWSAAYVSGNVNAGNISITGRVSGNLIPVGNNVQSLGNSTNYWANLWVANNTIYIGGVALGMTAGNVLTVNGNAVLQNNSNTTISTTGNITGNTLFGSSLNINDGNNYWTINGQTISGPGGSTLTSDSTSKDLSLGSGADGYLSLTSLFANSSVAVQWELEHTQARLFVNNGVDREWVFDDDGTITLPSEGQIRSVGNTGVRLSASASDATGLLLDNTGDAELYANSNVSVYTDAGNIGWTFGLDGTTIFPTLTVTRGDRSGTLTGSTIRIGDGTQEALLTTPNGVNGSDSQRLVINPGAGSEFGEGGDIYLYSGRGGASGGSGGDIKIRGGLAPADGAGGYLDIQGGDTQGNGTGGNVDIRGGESGNAAGGNVNLYGGYGPTVGGVVNVTGGQSGSGPGGNVTITGGVGGNGLPTYGNVRIASGASTWIFNNTGNLVLPNGGVVYETLIPFGGLDGKTIALKPYGGTSTDQQLLVYPTAGADANHLHLTSGNLYNTELFLGNDNLYVKLANTGDIVINTNDNAGNTAQWTFDTTGTIVNSGNLTLQTPSGIPSGLYNWQGQGGWNQGFYGNLATTGGTGTGLTVDVAAGGSGYISINQITINTPGTGYTNGDVITIDNENNLPGTFEITVSANDWEFGENGTLTLPGNTFAVNYANGTQVSLGGNYGNANVAANLAAFGSNPISTTGNITAGNLISSTGIVGNIELIMGNVANASATRTRILSDGAFSYIQTGNGTAGTTGNIVFSPYQSPTQRVVIDTASGNVTATGNVTAQNFTGNINITGNVQGTSSNVTLVAGSYSWTFDNTGNTQGDLSLTGGSITINNAPGGNEGAEIQWALPSAANTVLSTSLVQDVFQNGMRFFEAGGNNRGLYMDLGNVPNGSTTAVGYRDIPQVSFAGNTTIATTDAGRHYYSTQSTSYTLTIANNASQGFQVGAAITVVNQGTGNITVAQGSGVTLYLAGNATSGNRTVSTFGMATIIKVATDTWFINGTGVS